MQDPGRHQRLFEVFDAVADLPASEQAAAVLALCGDDAALADEVWDLIGHDRSDVQPLTGTEGVLTLAAELLTDVEIPETLGPYKIIRKLGGGGMGVVFEAEQDVPRRRVALKVVHPWLRTTLSDELLRQEVQSMAEVLHPAIPQVYQVFSVDDTTVVAMELVEGPTLDEAWPDLDRRTQLAALLQIADAVDAAHRAGVVHRDLKPGNIKVLPGGQPKVLDFGIASRQDHPGMAGAGTVAYAAPEQRSGNAYDGRVDVFALGVSMAELVTGQRPGRTEDGRVLLPERTLGDPAVDAIIRKATAFDPGQRYPRMAEMQRDLWAARHLRPVQAMGWSPWRWTRDWAIRNRVALAAVLGVILVISLVGAGALGGRALWFSAWQAARAKEMLADLRRQPLDTPEARAQAMAAFSRDPALGDSPHVSDAWTLMAQHASTEAEERAALARAWSTAGRPRQIADTARALAEILVEHDRWDAVRVLRESVVSRSEPAFDLYLALEGGDLEAARAVMTPAQQRLLPLLEHVAPDAFEMADFRPLVVDQTRWAIHDPAMAARLDSDGTRHPSLVITDVPGVVAGEAAKRFEHLLAGWPDRDAEAWRTVSGVVFGDADGDGRVERYDIGTFGGLPLAVSASVDSPPTAVLPWLTTDSNAARAIDLVDLDGDGRQEALVQFKGWTYSGLAVITGLPDDPEIVDLIRARRASAAPIRTRGGPAFLIVGSEPERPFRVPDEHVISSVHVGRMERGRVQLGEAFDHLYGTVREAFTGDLDGDGLDEVVVNQDQASWILVQEDDGWSRIPLPALQILGVADLDGDGRAEIWAHRGTTSMVLGAEHGTTLPAAPRAVRPATLPAPDAASFRIRQRWDRAEQLAALGLLPEAVAIFQDLAQLPGPTREPSLHRAMQWLESLEIGRSADQPGDLVHLRGQLGARLAASLVAGGRPAPDGLEDALRHDHQFDALVALGSLPDPGPWQPVVAGHAVAPAARLDPLAVRIRPASDDVLITITGTEPDDALRVPLVLGGSVVGVQGELDLDAQDFAHTIAVTLEIDGRPVGFRFGRYGGGPPDNHKLGMRCGDQGEGASRPWRAGRYAFAISVDLERHTLRCTLGDQALTVPLALHPTSSSAALRIGRIHAGGHFAQTRLGLDQLQVRGAEVPASEPDQAYRAIHGDRLATAKLLASATVGDRIAGAYLTRDPSSVDLGAIDAPLRWRLLRRDPVTWAPEIIRQRGDTGFAEDFVAAYTMPLDRMGDELLGVLEQLDIDALPVDSTSAWRIHQARAQADLTRGHLLQADEAFARLSTSPHGAGSEIGGVWIRLARRRLDEGDADGAAAALREAFERSPEPLPVLMALWNDPALAPLAPLPAGPRTTGSESQTDRSPAR